MFGSKEFELLLRLVKLLARHRILNNEQLLLRWLIRDEMCTGKLSNTFSLNRAAGKLEIQAILIFIIKPVLKHYLLIIFLTIIDIYLYLFVD